MADIFLYIIITVLVVGFGTLLYFLLDLKKLTEKPTDDNSMKVMMEWMKEIKSGTDATREGMQKSIDETNRAINERLDNAGKVIGALSKELGQMSQIGPDIRKLTETLASPKLRGNFGEEMLENLLSPVLPRTHYEFQHKFKSGDMVDAVVRVGDKKLPIDSKFSMENYRLYKEAKTDEAAASVKKAFLKDVKKRIDEIHKKYILPQEGTFDFALMFIPSEGVFTEILEDAATYQYSKDKKVYLVSPNSLYHSLQIIMLSLRGQKINEAAHQILSMIAGIKQESEKFGKNLDVLSTHIKNTANTMGTVGNQYEKLKTNIENAATLKLDEVEKDKIEEKIL
ncbi:MAG: hypothetical protein COT91_01570 [Candidatus Doudnabacteria bacterium CG10_big_fil_rev_8_21_14_0_10_41_10]|uniref:DNA recombination protein RmuC n=1 Tax=Candidatus Doudnabacteria bacterium CG10_big_fil_rev_8_21_14_0_10_41_10 TaxID=1974551 RepID=A0A2H0VE90_9BACT|nr:MAG: hypothetical protein COT91_01570 [Candidatus Doudnabacteria bacterium CG10_big_fil_rev_8_21_14_0_10_41_10]